MAHTGRCLCGQAHYLIASDPIGARMCWCRDCQKIASGSPTVNVLFLAADVQFSGEITRLMMSADSGNTVERGFCPVCGSQLYSRTIEPGGLPMRIRAGTLDNPELMAPQAIIWAASAPTWALLDPDLPHYPAGPPAATPAPAQ